MIKAGRREYVQVLRLLESFEMVDLHAAVKTALRMPEHEFEAILARAASTRSGVMPHRHI